MHTITHSWQIRMGNCVFFFLLCCSLYCWLIKSSSQTGYFNNVLKCEKWTSSTVGSVFEDHSRSSLRYLLQKRSCVEKPQVCISIAPPRVPFSSNLLSSAISFPAKPERVEFLFCLFRKIMLHFHGESFVFVSLSTWKESIIAPECEYGYKRSFTPSSRIWNVYCIVMTDYKERNFAQ